MELLIASSLSLVVTASMIALMSSSLGNTARIIKMTRLTDDLRSAMVLMSRDVRRSNYTANSINCFANPDCLADGSVDSPGDVVISDNNECFVFSMDRDQDGKGSENTGGFRRVVSAGVGVIQMWVGESVPDCASADASWVAVTDVNDIEITGFSVDDDLSYTEVVLEDAEGIQYFQKVRKVRMNISGRLISDLTIQRTVGDIIALRNNLYL
jgi:Tfp pilus assembly protein PilW